MTEPWCIMVTQNQINQTVIIKRRCFTCKNVTKEEKFLDYTEEKLLQSELESAREYICDKCIEVNEERQKLNLLFPLTNSHSACAQALQASAPITITSNEQICFNLILIINC